jgi:hypothetical protein
VVNVLDPILRTLNDVGDRDRLKKEFGTSRTRRLEHDQGASRREAFGKMQSSGVEAVEEEDVGGDARARNVLGSLTREGATVPKSGAAHRAPKLKSMCAGLDLVNHTWRDAIGYEANATRIYIRLVQVAHDLSAGRIISKVRDCA